MKYKDSDIIWFDKIPSHWKKTKNKFFLKERDEIVGENSKDYVLLSLTTNGVIRRDIESGKGKFPSSFEDYKKVYKGDLIFCLYDIDETPRTIGYSEIDGMISGSYKIFTCDESVFVKYIYYYYLNIDNFKGLRTYYTGLRNVIRPETFKSLSIYLPPYNEQVLIVNNIESKLIEIEKLKEIENEKLKKIDEYIVSTINNSVIGKSIYE
jgi:type I restriction enzyme S subunit